jgi:hypothetical protein
MSKEKSVFIDHGFEMKEDSVYQNEYYLIQVKNNKMYIARKENFKDFNSSTNLIYSVSEYTPKILEHLKRKPRKYDELVSGSICNNCAMDFNLSWPKGHCATFWEGECSQCGETSSCCSTGDYNYRFKGGFKKVSGLRD